MADPKPIGQPQEFWIDYEKLDPKTGEPTIVTIKPPETIAGGVFGSGNRPYKAIHIKRVTYDNGVVYDFKDDGSFTYVRTDPQLASSYRSSNETSAPTTKQDEFGNWWQWDASSNTWKQASGLNSPDIQDYNKQMRDYDLAAKQRSALGTPSADRPGEYEGRMLDNQYRALQIQKQQQELMNQYTRMRDQAFEEIDRIQQDMSLGKIKPADANKMMDMVRQNLDATLKGTTPFQMDQQRQNLADSVLKGRSTVGNSMAQALMNTFDYSKMLESSNPAYDFNPLLVGKAFADDLGGGEDMANLAKSILSGALGGF